jgi:hypothetical protein
MKDFLVPYFSIPLNKKSSHICLKWKHSKDSENSYAAPEVGMAECYLMRLTNFFQKIDQSLYLNSVQLYLPLIVFM